MNISEFVETKATGRTDPTGGRNRWTQKSFFCFLYPKFIFRQLIDLGISMNGLEDDISLKKKLDALEQQFDQVQQF